MDGAIIDLSRDLVLANRILAHEGVIDAFGHVSVRHPEMPDRYLISRHRAPELVEVSDILEFTLDLMPSSPTSVRLYGELVIHGCIYQARPDVQAICHHHTDAIMPFTFTDRKLVPIYHIGATMGERVPIWDSRDEFGDTSLVVTKPEEGQSLARVLGPDWIILMRHHGATVVGTSLRDVVYRTIYTTRNADLLNRAGTSGRVDPMSSGEIRNCFNFHSQARPIDRAWEYWTMRLQKQEAVFAMASQAIQQ